MTLGIQAIENLPPIDFQKTISIAITLEVRHPQVLEYPPLLKQSTLFWLTDDYPTNLTPVAQEPRNGAPSPQFDVVSMR
jgi:hypothetical protein